MTTAESATRMDTSSPDFTGTEQKKPSLLKKVKAKAKKLKSKLTPGQHHETENPNTPPPVDHENSSPSSSDGEEEETHELGYTPLSKAVNMDDDKMTAHAEQKDFYRSGKQSDESGVNLGGAIPEEEPSNTPLSQFRNPGPAGVEQAVPTSYNYYNQEPAAAYKTPSPAALGIGDSQGREGEESTGATPDISDSRPFGSDISRAGDELSGDYTSESRDFGSDKPFSTWESDSLQDDDSNRGPADRSAEEDRDAKIPVSILAPGSSDSESRQGRGDDEYFSSGSKYDQDQDVGIATPGTKMTDNLAGAKDAALDKLGYGSTDDQNPTEKTPSTDNYSPEGQKPIHQRAYEGVTGAAVGMDQRLGAYRDYDNTPGDDTTTSSSEPTMAQKAYDTVVGNKDAAAEKLSGSTNQSEPTVTQKVYDTMVGTKDAVVSKLPAAGGVTESREPTMAQKAYDTIVGTKDSAAQSLSGSQQPTGEPTVTQKAYDTVAGVKDAAANKLGVQSGIGTDSTSASGLGNTGFFDSSAAPVSEFNSSGSTDSKPVTQKVGETAATWKDSIAGTLGLGGSTTGTTPGSDRDLTAYESTTISSDQKPITEKLTEAGAGLKETVASKLGYEGSTTTTPGEEMVQNTKDTVVEKGRQADVGLSSDSTPVSQKAADTAYGAKHTTVSKLTPNEDDKALSQSVTETISNLPTLLSEKLGLGGPSPKSTATTNFQGPSELDVPVSNSPSQVSSAADTPDSPAPAASSPGIVNRVTGAMSSLFGGGKKTTTAPHGSGEEYSPTVSPSGSGRRDVTDTSPMVTDVGGGNTPRSSPAA